MRDRLEIILEILESIRFGNHLISHVAFSTFLPYEVAKKYIDVLELNGLVETRRERRRTLVFLTEKGKKAIRQIHNILELVKFEKEIVRGAADV